MFEDRSIRRRRRYILAAVFILLVSAAFGIGYFFNTEAPESLDDPENSSKLSLQIPDSLINPPEEKRHKELQDSSSNTDIVASMLNEGLMTPNTQLNFKTHYNFCRHTIEKSAQASNDEVNMDVEQLSRKYTGWEVTGFSPPIVELSRTIDAYCPNHYIIGEENGYIAIFVYDENGQKLLQEKTDISLAALTPEDQQTLQAGIVVDTEDQKEQILEGYSN